MPEPSPNTGQFRFLGGIASILSLLGVSLFFSGWIYRWAYYGYYHLEVTRLDLNPQSFLIVPLQIFLGSSVNILKSILVVLVLTVLINVSLWLVKRGSTVGNAIVHNVSVLKRWQQRFSPSPGKQDTLRLAAALIDELIIVLWVLILLFWFARHQGTLDAQRDAVHDTSTLPVITLLTAKTSFMLAPSAAIVDNELPADPVLTDKEVIVGEVELARIIRQEALNDEGDNKERVWRLLTERNGWIYIFPTLAPERVKKEQPIVVSFPKSLKDQLIILASDVPQKM